MTTPETFGERLRRLRTERGLRPGELAYKAGITEGAIRQMESGQTKTASLPVGIRMAEILGVNARYLALGEGPVTLQAADAGTESHSAAEDEVAALATGGKALAKAFRKLRERVEALEAWRREFEEPDRKRAQR